MRILDVYPGRQPLTALIEETERLDRSTLPVIGKSERGRDCKLCKLHEKARNPCIGADGEPGGLLVIGEGPGRDEDQLGRPFIGKSGKLLRRAVDAHWSGPVVYDNAMRCVPGKTKLADSMASACRGYLAQTLDEAEPQRIIALGAWAAFSLFGRKIAPFKTRRGYSFLQTNYLQGPIPVFFVIHPAAALRNSFVRQWWEHDMQWALTTTPTPPPWDAEIRIIEDKADALVAAHHLREHEWISFDVESIGDMYTPEFDIHRITLVGARSDIGYQWDWDALQDPDALAPMLDLLQDDKVAKGGSNVKYDQLACRVRWKIRVRPIKYDTRLMRKLIDPEASGALGPMAELVGMGGFKEAGARQMAAGMRALRKALRPPKPTKKVPNPPPLPTKGTIVPGLALPPRANNAIRAGADPSRYRFAIIDEDEVSRYNGSDALTTDRLTSMFSRALAREPALNRMWEEIVLPGTNALEQVEHWGLATSKEAIEKFDRYLEVQEVAAKKKLDVYPDVNWDSHPQVRELLFKKLGLKAQFLTKGGLESTNKETLLKLKGQHPVVDALVDYRWATHLRGTYAQGMYEHVRPDGRIHPNIKLDGARSGRTSCTDPNLQNIPRAQTPEGKMARDCFVAPPGYVLFEADYSQLELRVAAMLSKDPKMIAIFNEGVDYHLRTAQLISQVAWGIPASAVEDKHRSMAKSVNFGVLYGKTARTLAEEWGISVSKAHIIVNAIMGEFKTLDKWCSARVKEAKTTSFVWTWWKGEQARRRPLYRVADADDYSRSVAEHGAVNSPIQGTASDFCIASLIECVNWILDDAVPGVMLCLPVHDALLFQVRRDMVDETAHTVNEIMTQWDSEGIPLVADFKVGQAWGSMEKYKLAA